MLLSCTMMAAPSPCLVTRWLSGTPGVSHARFTSRPTPMSAPTWLAAVVAPRRPTSSCVQKATTMSAACFLPERSMRRSASMATKQAMRLSSALLTTLSGVSMNGWLSTT